VQVTGSRSYASRNQAVRSTSEPVVATSTGCNVSRAARHHDIDDTT
jgi:transposase-like protein